LLFQPAQRAVLLRGGKARVEMRQAFLPSGRFFGKRDIQLQSVHDGFKPDQLILYGFQTRTQQIAGELFIDQDQVDASRRQFHQIIRVIVCQFGTQPRRVKRLWVKIATHHTDFQWFQPGQITDIKRGVLARIEANLVGVDWMTVGQKGTALF